MNSYHIEHDVEGILNIIEANVKYFYNSQRRKLTVPTRDTEEFSAAVLEVVKVAGGGFIDGAIIVRRTLSRCADLARNERRRRVSIPTTADEDCDTVPAAVVAPTHLLKPVPPDKLCEQREQIYRAIDLMDHEERLTFMNEYGDLVDEVLYKKKG